MSVAERAPICTETGVRWSPRAHTLPWSSGAVPGSVVSPDWVGKALTHSELQGKLAASCMGAERLSWGCQVHIRL